MQNKRILVVLALASAGLFGRADAFPIQVDVGNGSVKAGWTQMTGSLGNDGVVTVDGVTFTASCYVAGDEKWRDYDGGNLGGDYFDCDNGFGNPDGSIILHISNLTAGDYIFTSYHNNAEPSYRCPLNIVVTGGISSSTTATNVPVTQNTVDDTGLGSGTVEFRATGSSDVVISFVPTCDTRPQGMMCLNAFELDLGSPTVQFEQPASAELESAHTAQLPVTLSESVGETVTVQYAVTGGTAANGVDYTIASSPLVFSPGQTSRTIDITIVDDGNDEQDETIEVTLSSTAGGGVVLGGQRLHTYTIIDPRPKVTFDSSTSVSAENVPLAAVPVSLSCSSGDTITVNYAVTGGTATNGGVDYTLAGGTLTFAPFETTQDINIAIVDDPCQEGPETILLQLSSPNNATLGVTTTHTFTINDDELGNTFINSVGMEFVLVMPGTFTMGSGDGHRIQDSGSDDYDEQPAHQVTISKPFYMLKTKVSQSHYQMSALPDTATDVSWNDANSFAQWLSSIDDRTYHLPTEAQWEYVYENPGVVEDMAGREWTRDWHGLYGHNDVVDPVGPENGVLKVIRGDGQDRWTLPTNATYDPWFLAQAGACSFRLIIEFAPPESPHVSPGPFCQAAIRQNTAVAGQGPDPAIPYFTVRFALPIPPDNITDGDASLLGCDPATVHHNHSPGFEIMPNGDALAVYFSAAGSEYGDDVRFIQARLRYGAEQWDMPELFWDMKGMNDESPLLWTEPDSTVHLFGGGRIDNSDRRPFVMAVSTDSGATWDLKRPYFPVAATDFTAQPVTNAWRRDTNTIYMVTDGSDSQSIVWESTDNGVTWHDKGGRTNGRHSTIVPIGNSGTLLSYGGKNSDIGGWTPWNKSYDWGASWPDEGPTVFSPLGSNQRPNFIRLANGKLAFCTDAQHRDNYKPPGSTYDYGCLVAISDNNGLNWHIKNLPVTLPHESDRDYGTLGYSTIRQAPNGTIHILTTMTHPCLHYELNEAWIYSEEGDITPETTGGTVNQYSEYYPGGAIKATWSARICTNGRYLLTGQETDYYEDGTKQYQVTYLNGKRTGNEIFRAPDGTKMWTWQYTGNTATWSHYWSTGYKRIESSWNTYPTARDLPSRNFIGKEAEGNAYHWGRCGQPEQAWNFHDGELVGSTELPPAEFRPADFDSSGIVDSNDLRTFSMWYLSECISSGEDAWCQGTDINQNYKVDLNDYALLAFEWLRTCP